MKQITESEAVELYCRVFPREKSVIGRFINSIVTAKSLYAASYMVKCRMFYSWRSCISKARLIRNGLGIIDE